MSEAYRHSAASMSRHVRGHLVTPPPIPEAAGFVAAIAGYAREHEIELIVPIFEEVFALAARREELPEQTALFAPAFETLAELHNKARFQALAERLGLRTPATVVATDAAGLREAAARFPSWVAKPVFSRAGTAMVTNVGPRAGERSLDAIEPTEQSPWLVQEYVEGEDLACLAVARGGRIAAYTIYEEPLETELGYSVRQRAIEPRPTLDVVTTLAEECRLEGFFGLDYRFGDDGPWVLECNPRSSAGAMLFDAATLAGAIAGEPPPEPALVEAGIASQFDTGIVAMDFDGLRSIPRTLRELGETPGTYLDLGDPVADLAGWLRYRHDSRIAAREQISYAEQKLHDVSWDGEPLA